MRGTLLNYLCDVFIFKGNVLNLSRRSCLMTELEENILQMSR